MRTPATIIVIAMLLGISAAAGIEYAYAPTVIAQGFFHPVAHKGSGSAVFRRGPNGHWSIRLTNFRTALRPDLAVYLISAPDAFDNDTVANSKFVSLGRLKGGAEDQVYVVPPEIDVSQYHAVTIWSERYQVNFTTAPMGSTRE
jgi:Electron transfer DM13